MQHSMCISFGVSMASERKGIYTVMHLPQQAEIAEQSSKTVLSLQQ